MTPPKNNHPHLNQTQLSRNDLAGLRVVAVHAHPDDEVLSGGGTLAQLARRGADVTVITCTLGEEGEVIGQPFAHLVADKADQLGGFRIRELQDSLSALGARGIFLGHPTRFRDSGMVGSRAAARPEAFVNNTEAATTELAALFAELRPHLVITYGPDGGYGHPDHIQAHQITHAAAARTPVGRIAWSVNPRAPFATGLAAISAVPAGWSTPDVEQLATVETWDVAVSLSDADLAAKVRAMRAHATQIWVADGSVSATNPVAARAAVADAEACPVVFALSNLIPQPVCPEEYFHIPDEQPAPADLLHGLEW